VYFPLTTMYSICRNNVIKTVKNSRKISLPTTKTKRFSLFGLIMLAICLAVGWWSINTYYDTGKLELKQPAKNNITAPASDAYRNLDLRVASRAVFSSPAVSQYKDLGVINGVRKSIISFSVPKDNLTEYGMMTLPTTPAPAGGYPVIILLHGYYDPWNYPTQTAFVEDMTFYSQHGFAVLKPDFRGQGLSIPAGSPEGAYYSMAYNTDAMSLIAAAKHTPNLDKSNINLWGQSMGGYVALRAAVLSPDVKNVILLSAPVAPIQEMFTAYVAISDTANSVASSIRAAQLDQHGTPLTNPGYWENTSPINFLDKTPAYIQIHVGTNDQIVPPKFSADLDVALTKLNRPHEYYVYQGIGHGLLTPRDIIWSRSLAALTTNH
jgi:dipeptidyl aminopeptidase/acylaminoacyl peptidase